MAGKKRKEIRLGRIEMAIMSVVWEMGKATVHDVRNAMKRRPKPAYTTVLTMMRKLEDKGYLTHKERDRSYVFTATICRENVRKSALDDLLERLFDGSPALLFNHLLAQKNVDEDQLREIRELLGEEGKRDD